MRQINEILRRERAREAREQRKDNFFVFLFLFTFSAAIGLAMAL